MHAERLKGILCINDNELTLFIQNRILNKSSISEEVITALDGKIGLDYCKNLISENTLTSNSYPWLIFLDLHMPVMDGWEFLHHFSADIWPHFKNARIIITSNSVNEADYERAKQYPFVIDFLTTSLSTEYLQNLSMSNLSYS
ncbi:response regulator [Daejeonella sp. H1SJ63]|jgi:CheY-like chemotaxis protein|uniref:response regulator n=1 Tax=Daejeonella sp. H1SJ63 TaxID=3034145 RepID=UPI0023EC3F87|nr:response regulator [Daejeonella sp. H1SJ63]